MRLRSAILAFVVIGLVGGLWLGRHQSRPALVKLETVVSRDASVNGSTPVSVIGTVQPSSRVNKGSEWWFTLQDGARTMAVHYTGRVPTTFFEEGAKVLVTGTLENGTFTSDTLLVSVSM
jgi:cytochrome c-type biogenesis protein CcmE